AETAADIARIQERANVARDLHDTFTQDLTALGLQLEAALHGVNDGSETGKRIVQALGLARSGVKRARESVERLREGPFAGSTFSGAIHETTRTFTSQTGIPVTLDVRAVELESNTETQLYAILTEALTNVRKHAHAKHVRISLSRQGGGIRLRISDDGVGMKKRTPAGFGIRGMRERAEFIGASLSIRGARPTGTTVAVRISNR
ncbi:MAG: sensor histidine kinase, partial [Candidatus Eremiobacteraeota bacterium]|nr:sensor histidine kinase [Candidatus Eremiobacteraeota bacterium]